MRQAGTLPTEPAARQFAAWLLTQRIDAHAEAEGANWAIWVRDEDQLDKAREALSHFRVNPQDERYRGAESSAAALLREEERKRQAAKGNVVEMRGRWGSGAGTTARRCPLVLTIIAICVLAALTTNSLMGDNAASNSLLAKLLIVDPQAILTEAGKIDVWASLRAGEVWRLVTPIFVHFGMMHLLFNMFWLFDMGGQIESRRGTLYLLLLVLGLAILSNLGQAFEASLRGGMGFRFGGMSGVVYGLLGYVFIKVKFDNRLGYNLSPGTWFLAMVWFVLCIARDYPPFDAVLAGWIPRIANTAHAVGLFAGMALAYLPVMMRRPSS